MKELKSFICDAGEFGTAIAIALASAGRKITLLIRPYSRAQKDLFWNLKCGAQQTNYLYLPGVKIPPMEFADNFEAARSADVIFLATPSKYVASMFLQIKECTKDNPRALVVLLTKGFDSYGSIPWGIKFCNNLAIARHEKFAVISGPTFAKEVVRPYQLHFASVASRDKNVVRKLKKLFSGSSICLKGTKDIVGVSWGGGLKNAYAIGYGLILKQKGESAAFRYIWEALDEMSVFLKYAGAHSKTVRAPAVQGDFYVTCRGDSRNKKFGEFLAECHSKEEIDAYIAQNTIEGYESLKILRSIAHENNLCTPLLESAYTTASP